MFQPHVIDREINCFIETYNLPFISTHSTIAQNKLNQLCNAFCKNYNFKLIFCPVKIGSLFSTKDHIPIRLSRIQLKFREISSCFILENGIQIRIPRPKYACAENLEN